MNCHQPHQRPVSVLRSNVCVWWDWKGVLYYELLLENQMINSKYCYQDNARPHVSLMTRQKWLPLAWEIWVHPPQAPDTAPLGFPFTSIIKLSSWKNMSILQKTIKSIWNSSLLKKKKKYGEDEIVNLPDKWQKVVEQNGEYIVQ